MYILLLVTTIGYAIQSIIIKAFSKFYYKDTTSRFSFFFIAFVIAFVILTLLGPNVASISPVTYLYGGLFGALFVLSVFIYSIAMTLGNAGTTSLIMSSGIIIPILVGTVFQGEPVTGLKILGFILIMIACALISSDGSTQGGTNNHRRKWLLFSISSSITNGALLTFSKLHQIAVPGKDEKEFIWFSMGVAAIVCIIILFTVAKKEGLSVNTYMKSLSSIKYLLLDTGLALSIFIPNLTLLLVVSQLPSIIVFPVSNTGSLIFVALASVFMFKEKLCTKGYVGMCTGIIAIMILNL